MFCVLTELEKKVIFLSSLLRIIVSCPVVALFLYIFLVISLCVFSFLCAIQICGGVLVLSWTSQFPPIIFITTNVKYAAMQILDFKVTFVHRGGFQNRKEMFF